MSNTVKPIPEGMQGFIPHLTCADAAKAIEFYKAAFGAVEVSRMPGPDGRLMHAQIAIDGYPIMLHDEMPEWGMLGPKARGGTSVAMHRFVLDVDAAFAKAVAAGATAKMPVMDQFWGDRYGVVVDPFGHAWSLATHVKDMTPQEMAAAGMEAMKNAPGCLDQTS